MSLEAIKTISESEESARRSVIDAAADAKKAVQEAEAAGKKAVEAAARKAQDELRELGIQADEKARAEAEELRNSIENKKAAMRAHAEQRLDKAAMLVVERIVSG